AGDNIDNSESTASKRENLPQKMISGPTNKRGKGRMGNRTHNANSSSIQPLSEQNPPASNFKN
ncbi:Protein of unknown function, partial [Cotesia congregata]